MSNIQITNNDLGSIILMDGQFRDDLLTFGSAGTVLSGTILARDSSTLKLVPYVKGGTTNGNGIPKAVITYDIVAAEAGDISVRDMISGTIRAGKIIIDADGDASNVDAAVIDELRSYCLVSIDVKELNILDNQ